MPEYVTVNGYQALMDAVKLQSDKTCPMYMYFFGEKDSDGHSWCPDCVAVEKTVETACREYADADSLVYMVNVGDRAAWKDTSSDNKFRQPPLQLTMIPTLLRWNGAERLEGDQIAKLELLQLFFDEAKLEGSSNRT